MGGVARHGELDRFDVADDMVGDAESPRPAAGIFEHGEFLAGQQFGNRFLLGIGALPDEGGKRAAGAHRGTSIMGRDDPAGEGDIGEVVTKAVDARVEGQ